MASLADISQKLIPNQFFHIFNRGINGQNIFLLQKNYHYFLQKYANYTAYYFDTYAYCLISNHFHFLVKVKSTEKILLAAKKEYEVIPKALEKELTVNGLLGNKASTDMPNLKDLAYLPFQNIYDSSDSYTKEFVASWIVSNQLRKLFLAYAKAFNKQEGRKGSLFQKPFRRKAVDNDYYLCWLIWYIHRNPIHHKIGNDIQTYKHSSYKSHLSNKPSLLFREEVLDLFHGKENFIQFHQKSVENWKEWQQYVIE